MNDDSLVTGDIAGVHELTADRADSVIEALAEAAHRHDVMVSITISPYQSDVDTEED